MRLAVVDTNVLVSGLLAGNKESSNRRIVDAMLSGTLRYVLSDVLLVEYRRVLVRPAIAQRHGQSENDADAVLESLVLNARFREAPAASGDLPAGCEAPLAPGDEHVVALMDAAPGAVLITGDHRLAEAIAPWHTVLTPAEFAATSLWRRCYAVGGLDAGVWPGPLPGRTRRRVRKRRLTGSGALTRTARLGEAPQIHPLTVHGLRQLRVQVPEELPGRPPAPGSHVFTTGDGFRSPRQSKGRGVPWRGRST